MVNPLEKWFRFKSEVFHALWAWEMLAVDIHRQRVEVYDSDVMFSQRVANWYRTFASGRDNVINGNRGGRRSSATIEYNTGRAKELIQTNMHVSLRLMASEIGLFLGNVQYTVVVTVQNHKVYARWVSGAFTDNNKPARIMFCLSLPQRYAGQENSCLRQVVTDDENGPTNPLHPVSTLTMD